MNTVFPEVVVEVPSELTLNDFIVKEQEFIKGILLAQQDLVGKFLFHIYLLFSVICVLMAVITIFFWYFYFY